MRNNYFSYIEILREKDEFQYFFTMKWTYFVETDVGTEKAKKMVCVFPHHVENII